MSLELDVEVSAAGLDGDLNRTSSGQIRPGLSKWAASRPGPSTREETFESIDAAVRMLKANASIVAGDLDLFENLAVHLSDGIHLTTEFSGMGGAEASLERVASAVQAQYEKGRVFGNISCMRASDKADHCQMVLKQHTGPAAPVCVFGDVTERMPVDMRRKLTASIAASRAHLWTAVARGKDKTKKVRKQHVKEIGRRPFKTVVHVLKKEVDTSQHAETCMAYCQQHRDYCSTFKQPTAIPGGSTAIRFLVAGINCFDWSIRGSQDGWLGQSCLSYFEIMREVLTCQYDLVIFECVREFDESGLEPFAEHYAIQSLTFSPTPLGLPCSRMRKYMMMALKASFEWIPEVGSFGARAMFEALFARSLQLYGHQLFAAPQAKIEEMRAQMVEARGMPAKRRSGNVGRSFRRCLLASEPMCTGWTQWRRQTHILAMQCFSHRPRGTRAHQRCPCAQQSCARP